MFIPIATAMRTTASVPVTDAIDPVIVDSIYTNDTQLLSITYTEVNPNRLYWALVTNPSTPNASQIVAGTGGGILEAGDVSYIGGFSGTISVTNEAGNELHLVATDVVGNRSVIEVVTEVVVDNTLPTADSAVTDSAGDTITITTSEPVTGIPSTSDFSFTGISAGVPTIDIVTVLGTSITIGISTNLVSTSDTVTVSYTKGVNTVKDTYNNELASFASLAVTNNVPASNDLLDEAGVALLAEDNTNLLQE